MPASASASRSSARRSAAVLILASSLRIGGAESVMRDLLAALSPAAVLPQHSGKAVQLELLAA